jgi:hypothetical protein
LQEVELRAARVLFIAMCRQSGAELLWNNVLFALPPTGEWRCLLAGNPRNNHPGWKSAAGHPGFAKDWP